METHSEQSLCSRESISTSGVAPFALHSTADRAQVTLRCSRACPTDCGLQEAVVEGADWASQVLVRSLTLHDMTLLIIPSACYFLTVALAGMGMLLIPASMAFMVQASCIIFTSACTVVAFPGMLLLQSLSILSWNGMVTQDCLQSDC